jgi:predicted transposase YdaD
MSRVVRDNTGRAKEQKREEERKRGREEERKRGREEGARSRETLDDVTNASPVYQGGCHGYYM